MSMVRNRVKPVLAALGLRPATPHPPMRIVAGRAADAAGIDQCRWDGRDPVPALSGQGRAWGQS